MFEIKTTPVLKNFKLNANQSNCLCVQSRKKNGFLLNKKKERNRKHKNIYFFLSSLLFLIFQLLFVYIRCHHSLCLSCCFVFEVNNFCGLFIQSVKCFIVSQLCLLVHFILFHFLFLTNTKFMYKFKSSFNVTKSRHTTKIAKIFFFCLFFCSFFNKLKTRSYNKLESSFCFFFLFLLSFVLLLSLYCYLSSSSLVISIFFLEFCSLLVTFI